MTEDREPREAPTPNPCPDEGLEERGIDAGTVINALSAAQRFAEAAAALTLP